MDGVQVSKLWQRRQGCKFNGTSYITQRAAAAVFTAEGQKQIRETIAYYQNNAKVMMDAFQKMGVWFTGGTNSPYIWLKCPDGMGSWEYFDYLLHNAEQERRGLLPPDRLWRRPEDRGGHGAHPRVEKIRGGCTPGNSRLGAVSYAHACAREKRTCAPGAERSEIKVFCGTSAGRTRFLFKKASTLPLTLWARSQKGTSDRGGRARKGDSHGSGW